MEDRRVFALDVYRQCTTIHLPPIYLGRRQSYTTAIGIYDAHDRSKISVKSRNFLSRETSLAPAAPRVDLCDARARWPQVSQQGSDMRLALILACFGTLTTAKGPTCSSNLPGDFKYEACGGFCKEEKAGSHCKCVHCSTPTCVAPAPLTNTSPPQILQMPRVRLLQVKTSSVHNHHAVRRYAQSAEPKEEAQGQE